MPGVKTTWYYIKNSVEDWCGCCSSGQIKHYRFTDRRPKCSSAAPPSSSRSIEFITPQGLDDPSFQSETNLLHAKSKPKFRLKWNFGKYLKDESSTDSNGYIGRDSSTTRESGYGRSIEEESINTELLINVTQSPSKLTYIITLQSSTKQWVLHRSRHEFLTLQQSLKNKVHCVYAPIPITGKVRAEDLNLFLNNVVSDGSSLQNEEIRKFLALDRCQSSSSSSSENNNVDPNDVIPAAHLGGVILSPQNLIKNSIVPPRIPPPIPPRNPRKLKSKPDVPSDNCDSSCIPISKVPLGCEEKRMTTSDFDFLSVIGKGSFGKVMMARKKDDHKIYAVKMLSKKMILRRNETAHVLSERSVLIRVLKHPYVVQLYFAFTSTTRIFFVLDYVNGGELFFHLQNERTFSESRTRFYGAEICCALTYMHMKGIVYRDLKPENLLLDREGHVVLTDFGLCKEGLESASSRTATFCGTPEYLAPEIILKMPYTRSVDWWTFGAVLYEMMYGLPPFYSKDTTAMYQAIIKKPLKLRNNISPAARDILIKLLNKNASRRLGSGPNDGCEVQVHPFFDSINWDMIERRELKPEFVPKVSGDDDLNNIDPMFTKEPITPSFTSISPDGRSPAIMETDNVFRGFSYIQPILIPEVDR